MILTMLCKLLEGIWMFAVANIAGVIARHCASLAVLAQSASRPLSSIDYVALAPE